MPSTSPPTRPPSPRTAFAFPRRQIPTAIRRAARRTAPVLAALLALTAAAARPTSVLAMPHASSAQAAVSVEVRIGSVWVNGTAPAGAAVAVVHKRALDGDSATFRATAGASGGWTVVLKMDGGAVTANYRFLDPGDQVTVEVDGGGDPVVLTVPSVHVESDPDGDRVFGSVPPGVTASVEIIDPNLSSDRWTIARLDTPVGPDGAFSLRTAADFDLLGHHVGTVRLTRPDGHRFVARWSYARITINPSIGMVVLNAHNHLPYDVTFALPNGQPYFHKSGRIAEHGDGYSVPGSDTLNDPQQVDGKALAVRPGDRVTARFGAQVIEVVIPLLSVWADPARRVVLGQAPPGVTVEILWIKSLQPSPAPKPWRVTASGNAAGLFRHDLATGESLSGGDMLAARLLSGRIRLAAYGYAAHVRVDLDSGEISGSTTPGTEAVVVRSRAGQPDGEVRTRANLDGMLPIVSFGGENGDDGEEPFTAGDDITVRTMAAAAPSLHLTIPPFSAGVRRSAGPFAGRAEPGPGRLLFVLQPSPVAPLSSNYLGAASGPNAYAPPVAWQPDGTFEVPYRPGGSDAQWQPMMFAFLWLPDGHVLVRRGAAPTLSLSLGGRRMCGLANPRSPVAVHRTRADQTVDQWTTAADAVGRWSVLTEADAVPVGGETWRGDAVGAPFAWTVPSASWTLDWAAMVLRFRLPPLQPVQTQWPIRADCWDNPVPLDTDTGVNVGGPDKADADGRLDMNIQHSLTSLDPRAWDLGSRTTLRDPSAPHRLLLDVRPMRLEAHLGTPRLVVRASPGVRVSAHASGPGANAIGDGAATADDRGDATLLMADAGGTPSIVESGARLTLTAAGEEVALTIPPFDFDLSRARGAIGTAPPGATVRVRMLAGDRGAPYEVPVPVDPAGVWRVSPSLLDARGGFDWLDVTALEAQLRVGNRHSVVRTVPLEPVVRRYVVWMPFAFTWRR